MPRQQGFDLQTLTTLEKLISKLGDQIVANINLVYSYSNIKPTTKNQFNFNIQQVMENPEVKQAIEVGLIEDILPIPQK